MVGINRLTLRKIEAGEANPTMDVMLKISQGLDVPLSNLVLEGEVEEKTSSEKLRKR